MKNSLESKYSFVKKDSSPLFSSTEFVPLSGLWVWEDSNFNTVSSVQWHTQNIFIAERSERETQIFNNKRQHNFGLLCWTGFNSHICASAAWNLSDNNSAALFCKQPKTLILKLNMVVDRKETEKDLKWVNGNWAIDKSHKLNKKREYSPTRIFSLFHSL